MENVHEALTPLNWLIGKWVCNEGAGHFPTISPFSYSEQIEFQSFGQPLLHYKAQSWNPEKKTPMHSEAGFLRVKPGTTHLAFMVAHNNGLSTLEEGEVTGEKVSLASVNVSRMSFAKDPAVTKIERIFTLNQGRLEQVVYIGTTNTPLTEHLKCSYEKMKPDE